MSNLKLLFLLVLLSSCTGYIRVFNSGSEPNDNAMKTRIFNFPSDTLKLQFFGDYRFDTLNKQHIIVTNNQAKQLISQNLSVKNVSQFIFAFTDLPEYYNVFGFYYPNSDLDSIATRYKAIKPYKRQYSSLMYVYEKSGFIVADVFREIEGGTVRFVNICKYRNDAHKEAFIEREIYELYFVRN